MSLRQEVRNRSVFAKVKARSSEVLVRYGFLFERLGVPSKKICKLSK